MFTGIRHFCSFKFEKKYYLNEHMVAEHGKKCIASSPKLCHDCQAKFGKICNLCATKFKQKYDTN